MKFVSHQLIAALALGAPTLTGAAYCNGKPDPGDRVSPYPIFDEEPTFVRSVKNAALFEAGPANARFELLHVYGTPYEVSRITFILLLYPHHPPRRSCHPVASSPVFFFSP